MIYRYRSPAGKRMNTVHGLCAIGDGLVRIFSLGFSARNFPCATPSAWPVATMR